MIVSACIGDTQAKSKISITADEQANPASQPAPVAPAEPTIDDLHPVAQPQPVSTPDPANDPGPAPTPAPVPASAGIISPHRLIIHAAEMGIAKFHRRDNEIHPYGPSHAWLPSVLSTGIESTDTIIHENADGSVTVFFYTLQDVFNAVVQISRDRHMPVSVLNIHAHGAPGIQGFPADRVVLQTPQCAQVRSSMNSSDQANYDEYYHPISNDSFPEIDYLASHQLLPSDDLCISGLDSWTQVSGLVPEFKTSLASDVQIHFLSCFVGKGTSGERFTTGLGGLLLQTDGAGRVETSVAAGAGDWSMPQGMGFWDRISEDQVVRDAALYVANRRDADMAQRGNIRVAAMQQGARVHGLRLNREFMNTGYEEGALQIDQMDAAPVNVVASMAPTRAMKSGRVNKQSQHGHPNLFRTIKMVKSSIRIMVPTQ